MQDTFNGALAAFTFYDAYLTTVAEEIGMEGAISLHSKMCETMGAQQGQMMKEQAGAEVLDAKTGFGLTQMVPEGIGISYEMLEESPQLNPDFTYELREFRSSREGGCTDALVLG